jgi:acetylornithine deacetylase/succinyl-diaminopimelate desuccinylase-like protein
MINVSQINDKIEKEKNKLIADYKRFVECPSVSSQSEHKKDILQTAQIAKEILESAGATVKIFETSGHPTVWGRIENDPNGPTVAIYNHIDVQPAEKGKNGWTRDPFTFVEENGRFYSRGTTDDKGPAMTAFWGARMAKEFGIKTNIEFIWELEEEIGSPNFHEAVEQIKKVTKADSIIVSDTIWLDSEQPAMTKSLRGLVAFMVNLKTSGKDVHSGLCGGIARNPITELCDLISKCINAKTGEITIPGFDKTWPKPSAELIQQFVDTGFSVEKFKDAHKLIKLRSEKVEDVVAAIWAKPTFEVHGIAGGYQGENVKTVVPNEAQAKLSMRMVPGQDPMAAFECFKKYAKELNPDCVVEMVPGILKPFEAPTGTPQNEKIQQSVEFGFSKRPVYAAEGGSIGAVVTMNEMLGIPVYFLGLSLPEDSYHGPDESFAWKQMEGGVKAFVKYFELLSN